MMMMNMRPLCPSISPYFVCQVSPILTNDAILSVVGVPELVVVLFAERGARCHLVTF